MVNYEEDSESDSEFEPGKRRKRVVHDEGMVLELHEKTGPNREATKGSGDVDGKSIKFNLNNWIDWSLTQFCLNDREQFKTMFKDIDLNMQIWGKYPVLMEILEEPTDENYSIETPLR